MIYRLVKGASWSRRYGSVSLLEPLRLERSDHKQHRQRDRDRLSK